MKARSRFALITTTLVALSLSAIASAELKSKGEGKVHFALSKGTGGMVVEGDSTRIKAHEADGKVIVTVHFSCGEDNPCFKTGGAFGLRDKHLVKYVTSEGKNPAAKLEIEKSKLTIPEDGKSSAGDVEGKLTLNGVTNAQKFHYEAKRSGGDITVNGRLAAELDKYNIKPSYMGIKPGNTATVTVTFQLHDG